MRVLIVLLCLCASSCDERNPAGPTVGRAERFVLAAGQTATLRDTGVAVEFVTILNDSRCPGDAVCVRMGEAVMQLRVHDNGLVAAYDVASAPPDRAFVIHRDLRIDVVEVQPYPFGSRRIESADYRVTLSIQ